MNNQELANIFYKIADILELKNVEWKPQAYRKAARAIESLTNSLEDIYNKKGIEGLDNIPGIGIHIAKKIEEYIKIGKILEFEKLQKEIPKGFYDLMEISGLGPKSIRKLYAKLNIKSISDLQKAIKEKRIENLFGFGEKTEEKFEQGIELFNKRKKRILLGIAYPLSQSLISEIKNIKYVDKVEIAGSLRRRLETIGDFDILITSKNPNYVVSEFIKLKDVKKILVKGNTKVSVLLKNDVQCDLRIISEEKYGSALLYFTGNKDHNINLRKIAIKKGYKLSEYGLFKNDKVIASRTEKEIYNKLGFQYIEPELRENNGELNNKLPNLISYNDIKGDLHIHTNYSDGINSIYDMINAAQKRKYQYIGITDHSKARAIANGLNEERLLKQINEINKLQNKFDIKILKGMEIDIKVNGDIDLEDNLLKKLDYGIVSIHSSFNLDKQKMTSRIISALSNEKIKIFGHPTTRLINQRNPISIDFPKLFKFCSENNKFIEINSQPDRLDLNDINIREGLRYKVKFVINTDSHNVNSFDYIKYGIAQARRGWCEKKDIINTLSLKEFLKKF
ncbi:MAG: DNA polymerase/3'-5' exonuclease PolX [Candidatus Nanoarchaeia archaeon]|nr:DNA polymerase/3'-5' exonuclease PolX [Candidatus Nanoarchaeia archaeon]